MRGWWRRKRKQKPAPRSRNKPFRPHEQQSMSFTPPSFQLEPDYEHVPNVVIHPPAQRMSLASLVVVGVGGTGQRVLQRLRRLLAQYAGEESAQVVTLLAVGLQDSAEEMCGFPFQERILDPSQELGMPLSRDRSPTQQWPWLPEEFPLGQRATRVEGRLAVFQDLQRAHPDVWEALGRHLGRGDRPDVWLVGSTFEATGSGMIFDLAHLIRLVGRSYNYEPFIGWMLALPGDEWGRECWPEAVATLREWQRLAVEDERAYMYNPYADNQALHAHSARGQEDCHLLFLVRPPVQEAVRAEEEGQAAVDLLATALFALAERATWQRFREDVEDVRRAQRAPHSLLGTFGLKCVAVPLDELQENVRRRLAYDLLFDDERGLFKGRAVFSVAPDEETARGVLLRTQHPLLEAIARSHSTGREWSGLASEQVLFSFAGALREQLQRLVDEEGADGLAACYALLQGLKGLLSQAHAADPSVIEKLITFLRAVEKEMKSWIRWSAQARREAQRAIAPYTRRRAERRRTNPIWTSEASSDVVERIYHRLSNPDLFERIRQHVRWAWVVEGTGTDVRVRLYLDTLYPGWRRARRPTSWRLAVGDRTGKLLWQRVLEVVQAYTQEPAYWPQSLSNFHQDQEVSEVSVCLEYNGSLPEWSFSYLISGDETWREASWGASEAGLQRIDSGVRTLGVTFRWWVPLRFEHVSAFVRAQQLYLAHGRRAKTLHIFEPEQQALLLEYKAFGRHIRHRRGKGERDVFPWLPETVMRWLVSEENRRRVRAFVGAWFAGNVECHSHEGRCHLVWQNRKWTWHVRHPLDALVQFMETDWRDVPEEAINEWNEWLSRPDNQKRVGEILNDIWAWQDDWHNPKNVHWFILAWGFSEM